MPSELEKLNMAKDNYNNGEITEQEMNDIINGLHAMGYGIVVGFINYVIDNPSNQSFDDAMVKNFPGDEDTKKNYTNI